MKTVIQPATVEESLYSCDVTGSNLPFGPATTIIIRCGYGAIHDGAIYELHFSEAADAVVLPIIRALLLDGAPLERHRTQESLDGYKPRREKRVSASERARLLRRLAKLRGANKTIGLSRGALATVNRGVVESAQRRTIFRGSFAKHAK